MKYFNRINLLDEQYGNEDSDVPNYLFDVDDAVAALTGQIRTWPGSLALAAQLLDETARWLSLAPGHSPPVTVLELGSGQGLVGLCAAWSGARVFLTDLPPIVEASLRPNVALNETSASSGAIGPNGGTTACFPLDWTKATRPQLEAAFFPDQPLPHVDVILAAETVFLESLVDPFVETALECMDALSCDRMVLAFCDRSRDDSQTFVGPDRVRQALARAGHGFHMDSVPQLTLEAEQQLVQLFLVQKKKTVQ